MIGFTCFLFLSLFCQQPVYEAISSDIIKNYSNEVLLPNNLSVYVIGGSSDKGIKSITIGVNNKGPGTIKEGRRLVVHLVSELIKRYNECTAIQPYLLNYPFDEKNFIFKISFVAPDGGFWIQQKDLDQDEQIALIGLYGGTIYYSIDPDGEMKPLQEIYEETFADALKIVEEVRSTKR